MMYTATAIEAVTGTGYDVDRRYREYAITDEAVRA